MFFVQVFRGLIQLGIGGDLINLIHDIEKALHRLVDNGHTFIDVQVIFLIRKNNCSCRNRGQLAIEKTKGSTALMICSTTNTTLYSL